jgi:phage-related protein
MPAVRYFRDARGDEPVGAYVDALARRGESVALATLLRHIELVAEFGTGLRLPNSRLIDRRERIYELRPGDHRIAYAEVGGEIVLLHAWRKRSQALDQNALSTARLRLRRFKEEQE